MARLRDFETKNSLRGFRAVLFRMVSKQAYVDYVLNFRFRAVLFRMVSKLDVITTNIPVGFRAVLFRMVSKPENV